MTKCSSQFKNRKELIELVSSEVKASFEKTSSSAARPSWTAAPTSLWASSLAWEYQVLCWKTSSTLLKNIKYFVEEHPASSTYLENIKYFVEDNPASSTYLENIKYFNLPSSKWCTRNNNIYIAKQNKSDVKHFKCHYRYGLTPLTRRLVAISETIFPASRASTRAAARALRALPSCWNLWKSSQINCQMKKLNTCAILPFWRCSATWW